MKVAIMQIGKNGFQDNNYTALKSTLMGNDQVRLKFFKTSGVRGELENLVKELKIKLETDIKRKIIIKKIGFTLVINKLRKRLL